MIDDISGLPIRDAASGLRNFSPTEALHFQITS
jgi:hypothetical protein